MPEAPFEPFKQAYYQIAGFVGLIAITDRLRQVLGYLMYDSHTHHDVEPVGMCSAYGLR